MMQGVDNWFFTMCSLRHVAQRQNVVATSNKVQSSQKTILCLLVQEPCAGTVPSTSYKKWGNVWLIYGSLCWMRSSERHNPTF